MMHEFDAQPESRIGSWPCVKEAILGLVAREKEAVTAVALFSLLLPRVRGIELSIHEVRAAINSLLLEDMIVAFRVEEQEEPTYLLTTAGADRLGWWLPSALYPPYRREELLLRIAVASGPKDLREIVKLIKNEVKARMEEVMTKDAVPREMIVRTRSGLSANDWRMRMKLLLDSAEIGNVEAELRWLHHVLTDIAQEFPELRGGRLAE